MTQPPGPDSPGSSPDSGYPPPPPPGGYPPPPPPGYAAGYPPAPPQPYSGYAPSPTGMKNGLGLAALIVGLISLPASLTIIGGFILGITAIILGFVARGRVRRGEADNGGVALSGILLGALGTLLSIVVVVFAVVAGNWFLDIGGRDFVDCMTEAGDDAAAQAQCEDEFRGKIEDNLSVTLTPTR